MCYGPIKVLGVLAEIIKQVCAWLRGASQEGPALERERQSAGWSMRVFFTMGSGGTPSRRV